MPDYWFFLSYARLDRDAYLKRFYQDLSATVRQQRGLDVEHIGFFDSEDIEPGDTWIERLAEGLQTSRVFVSLYSPTYFTREYCGREWQVFRSRLEAHIAATGKQHPPLIIPVLWVPLDHLPHELPKVVSEVQYTHDDFGEVYKTEGLRQIMALNKYRDDYQAFLVSFARKLIQAADQYQLPPLQELKPLEEINSAFHQSPEVIVPPKKAKNRGLRYVKFVYVAGRRDELQALRQNLHFYGEECEDWRPYVPEIADEITTIAQEVIWREKMRYEVLRLDANIIQNLQAAEQDKKLVVLIADTWTLNVGHYQQLMNAYDRYNSLYSILVIVWNLNDEETVNNLPRLENNIFYTLPNKASLSDPNSFLGKINTADDLKLELSTALNKARMRITTIEKVIRRVESERLIPKPTIIASQGSSI